MTKSLIKSINNLMCKLHNGTYFERASISATSVDLLLVLSAFFPSLNLNEINSTIIIIHIIVKYIKTHLIKILNCYFG